MIIVDVDVVFEEVWVVGVELGTGVVIGVTTGIIVGTELDELVFFVTFYLEGEVLIDEAVLELFTDWVLFVFNEVEFEICWYVELFELIFCIWGVLSLTN